MNVQVMESEFIGKNKCGIPSEVFKTAYFNDVVEGGSGKTKLDCEIRPDYIFIGDSSDKKFYFKANRNDNVMHLDIITRGWKKNVYKPHPDLFPSRLVEESLDYFKRHGQEIQKVQGAWMRIENYPSGAKGKNYSQFVIGKKNGLTDIEAASQTWTGYLLSELGFTVIEEPFIKRNSNGVIVEINVLFKKS